MSPSPARGPVRMQVLFVHAAFDGTPFNCSIAALSAWLKQHGVQVSLALVREADPPDVVRDKLGQPAEVVAFSFMTCQAEWVAQLVAVARDVQPDAKLVAGGAHPTTYPRETLAALDVDAVCAGEGEGPFLAWLEDPERAIPGMLRRGEDDPIVRWQAPDVDALPDWDRALFPSVINSGNRYEEAVGVAFSRGFCVFSCTFCGIDGYRRVHGQPLKGAVRLRSGRRVLDEMHGALDSIDCSAGFAVWDEILPTKPSWLGPFAKAYRDEIGLPLAAQARIEQITPRVVEALATAGCDYLVIGLECGDEAYRKKVLNKGFTNAQALEAIDMLEAAGVRTYCSFMLGLPLETPRMLASTVRFARQLPETADISWKYYTPERGTRLFALLEQHDLLIDRYVDRPFGASEPTIRLARCSRDDVLRAARALELLR